MNKNILFLYEEYFKKEQETCKTQQKNSNICGIESQKKRRSEAEATFGEIIARNFTNG